MPRTTLAIVACMLAGCASRSSLHGAMSDATADTIVVDAGPEVWSREVSGGAECASRPTTCVKDDFGPRNTVASVFLACAEEVANPCGDLILSFAADGCLVAITDIVDYSPAFVDCVARTVSANRWICVTVENKSFHMTEACTR